MPAYAASARIVRVTPRLAILDRVDQSPPEPVISVPNAGSETVDRAVGSRWEGSRWEAFRERWSQLTFYLFDANSWR
ncbi:MAG: hypothetical protein H0V73_12000 [Chloroflexi bacterium]|nr:hypothetical protein [Chloroflexota bacterium]